MIDATMQEMTIQQIHDRALPLLKAITAKCDELGVPWFVSDGTLLGAMRHNGFIPWDDDVDIFIPAGDRYDELMRHYADFKYPYHMSNEHTEPGWLTSGCKHGQMHDLSTVGINRRGRPVKGVFVDLFPFCDCGNGLVHNKYLRTIKYNKEWWTDYELHKFEDTYVRVPKAYDSILTKAYGDWRTPKQYRPMHGRIRWYDVPYDDYVKTGTLDTQTKGE